MRCTLRVKKTFSTFYGCTEASTLTRIISVRFASYVRTYTVRTHKSHSLVNYGYRRCRRQEISPSLPDLSYVPRHRCKSVRGVFRDCSLRCECYFSGPVASFSPNHSCCGFECATETPLSISSFAASIRFGLSASMVYSDYVKQRILFYHRLGKSYADIADCLSDDTKPAKSFNGCLQVPQTVPEDSHCLAQTREWRSSEDI